MEMQQKSVMIEGFDDSDESYYALEWTLDHILSRNSPFKLIIVHSKPSTTSVIGVVGAGAADVIPVVKSNLRKIVAQVVERAKELCRTKSVDDVIVEVAEGNPRYVLCEAVERHRAPILVIVCHGYGAIKRAVLGSLSDCYHAHCMVMISKKPKTPPFACYKCVLSTLVK